MNDFIDEELQIAKEQDGSSTKALSAETFNVLIEDIDFHKPLCLDVSSSIKEACELMQTKKIGSVLVTENDKLTGIITERDILMKVIGKIDNLSSTKLTEVMTSEPISLQKIDKIAYAMNNMHVGGYRHVPVVNEENEPIAVISIKDVMSYILDHFPDEVLNLTGQPYRGPVSREGA